MELTMEQMLQGKATRIKDKEYFTTEAYVLPFIERVSKLTDSFIIQAKPADQISLTKEGEINFDDVIYNRVWIQGVLPDEFAFDNHKRVISMLYALDTRKPLVKFYTGALNMALPALYINSEPESAINYSFLRNAMSITEDIGVTLKRLSEMEFKRDDIFADLGHWVDNCIRAKINNGFGNIKLTESAPIDVYKDLFYDEKSKYYTEDDRVDGFTVYNAFTDLITQDKRDLVNKFEKTLLIKDIMDI